METTSSYLPENEPVDRTCPKCKQWNLEGGGCDWCNYQDYQLENGNDRRMDNDMLRMLDF